MLSWDSTPRSFGMDRRSPVADKLRAAVADELFHFLGDYSDDVLAVHLTTLTSSDSDSDSDSSRNTYANSHLIDLSRSSC